MNWKYAMLAAIILPMPSIAQTMYQSGPGGTPPFISNPNATPYGSGVQPPQQPAYRMPAPPPLPAPPVIRSYVPAPTPGYAQPIEPYNR